MMRYLIPVLLLLAPLNIFGDDSANEMIKEEARVYRQKGYEAQARGDLQEALSNYQKAVELDPTFFEVINDLGVVYESLGQDAKALAMYKRAIEINPRYLAAYTNLGFLYERLKDVKKATLYWRRRYELGKKGDYWTEVAKQHLMTLGTYPEIRREFLEEAAANLSKDIVHKRLQEKLARNEEAQLHLDLGIDLLKQGEYPQALKEFEIAKSHKPSDLSLRTKIDNFIKRAQHNQTKRQALNNVKLATGLIEENDFLSAGEKLRDALSAVFKIAREK